MRIALIQTNPVIGDFSGNCAKILEWVNTAKKERCGLAVFPELTLCGYPPQDLLERNDFLRAHDRHLRELVSSIEGIKVILGAIEHRTGPGKPLHNTAIVVENKRIACRAHKQLLPTYDVFDETRYFEPGKHSVSFQCDGMEIGLSVCEDIWYANKTYPFNPVERLLESKNTPP